MPIAPPANGHAGARFARFLLVGGINTAVGYAIYALGLYTTGHVAVASALSLIVGIGFSFKAHRRFVFAAEGPQARAFLRYVVAWLVVYAVNLGALTALVRSGMNGYLAGAVLILPVAMMAFAVMRLVVFPPPAQPP
jgi:putative flippase GtrA